MDRLFKLTLIFLTYVNFGIGSFVNDWPIMVFEKGETATIPCLPQGDANAYFWRKGKWFNISENIASIVHGISDTSDKYAVLPNGSLAIKDVSNDDEGRYFCRIASEVNECHGQVTVYVQVTTDELALSIEQCDSRASCTLEFQPLSETTLTCTANFISNSMKILWHDGLEEISGEVVISDDAQKKISKTITINHGGSSNSYLTCEAVGLALPRNIAQVQLKEKQGIAVETANSDIVWIILVVLLSVFCLILGSLLVLTCRNKKIPSYKEHTTNGTSGKENDKGESTALLPSSEQKEAEANVKKVSEELDNTKTGLKPSSEQKEAEADVKVDETERTETKAGLKNDRTTEDDLENADSELDENNEDQKNMKGDPRHINADSRKTTPKLTDTEIKLQKTTTELTETKTKLQKTTTELTETKTKLQKTTTGLTETKTKLQKTTTELTETKTKLQKTTTELTETKTKLQKTTTELTETETKLENVTGEFDKAKQDIQTMFAETSHRTTYAQKDLSEKPRIIIRLNSKEISVKEDSSLCKLLNSYENAAYYSGPEYYRETHRELKNIVENVAYGGRYCIVAFGCDENTKNVMFHQQSGVIPFIFNRTKALLKDITQRGLQVNCSVSVLKITEKDKNCSFEGPSKQSHDIEKVKLSDQLEVQMNKYSLLAEPDLFNIVLETIGNLQSKKEHGVVRFALETILSTGRILLGGLMIAIIRSRDKVHSFCSKTPQNDFAGFLRVFIHDPKAKCFVLANCSAETHGDTPLTVDATKKVIAALTDSPPKATKGAATNTRK